MELNFDKEIDALLRRSAKSETFVNANGSNSVHIYADALSAFAENALPQKTRTLYMTHLGDCDRCRQILSNLILLNAESEAVAPAAAGLPEIAVAPTPWYRKLFIFPNLAYSMGALVLVFSGLLGFVVIQRMQDNQKTNVAQVSDKETQNYNTAPYAPVSNAPAAAANTTSNANSSVEPGSPGFKGSDFNAGSLPLEQEAPMTADKRAAGPEKSDIGRDQDAAAAPLDESADRTRGEGEISRKPSITTDGITVTDTEKKNEMRENTPSPPPPPPVAASQAPPAPAKSLPVNGRRMQELDVQKERAKDDAKLSSAAGSANSGSRRLSGKSFNRTGGVWYDSAYSGQPTTDVRRGTDQYRKLDSGLRSIADNLGGTVVVVWKSKAYRIQ